MPPPELLNHWPILLGDIVPPEPPAERLERICDTRYVRLALTTGWHAYGVVVNSRPVTHELLVEWWNPLFPGVQTDVFRLGDVSPLGERRDAVTYTDAAGSRRRGFVVCVDGDVAVLEHWRPGARWPLVVRVAMAQVQPFDRLLRKD